MSSHGPDEPSYQKAVDAELAPQYMGDTRAFMFESRYIFEPTAYALNRAELDKEYDGVWAGFGKARIPGRK
jgi:homogentisate 1,2-dioxygenase